MEKASKGKFVGVEVWWEEKGNKRGWGPECYQNILCICMKLSMNKLVKKTPNSRKTSSIST